MKLVRERINDINELAGYVDKNPHGDFQRAKEALYEEVKKYVKVSLKNNKVEFPKSRDVILLDVHHGEKKSPWKETFAADYIDPIEEALKVIQETLQDLDSVEGVGDMHFPTKKKSWREKLRDLGLPK